jgi:hypothetical protein
VVKALVEINMSKILFTVILDFDGTNSVSQFYELGPEQAFQKWRQNLNDPVKYDLKPDRARVLAEALQNEWNEHVESELRRGAQRSFVLPVSEMTNVWCVWLSVGEKCALINIIATSSSPSPSNPHTDGPIIGRKEGEADE